MINGAPRWVHQYRRGLILTDTVVVIISVAVAHIARFGITGEELAIRAYQTHGFSVNYTVLSTILGVGWLVSLSALATRDPRVFGIGGEEFKRVISATFITFGTLAIVAFSLRSQVGRGYVFIALPLGLVLLLCARAAWRAWLVSRRKSKTHNYKTLIVGDRAKSEHVARQIMSNHANGFWIVGAVTEHGTPLNLVRDIEVVSDYDGIIETVDRLEVQTVVLTSSDNISPERIRQLGWELESRNVDLIVAAALTDIAGPRIHTRPVAGLPLIQVDYPRLSGRKRFVKRAFDILGSGILLILLSPVYLVVAIAVKTTSRGPIFYSQDRIGLSGTPFPMFKFRSMVENADDQLQSLLDAQGTSDKPLHKIEDDPRITPVGRFIRRYSLDELPQLANVFVGHMSLVGPRPQREAEVALYAPHHFRRLLVKPGVTGLWQVSGRSSLSWEDAIRLDLYYVENWSLTGDVVLLWKTIRAVASADGAH